MPPPKGPSSTPLAQELRSQAPPHIDRHRASESTIEPRDAARGPENRRRSRSPKRSNSMDGRGSEGGAPDPRRGEDDRDRRSGREDLHRRSERRPATGRDDDRERDRERDVRERDREREKDRSRRESDRETSRRDRERERDVGGSRLPTGPARDTPRDDRMPPPGNSPGRKRPRDPRDEEVRSLKVLWTLLTLPV